MILPSGPIFVVPGQGANESMDYCDRTEQYDAIQLSLPLLGPIELTRSTWPTALPMQPASWPTRPHRPGPPLVNLEKWRGYRHATCGARMRWDRLGGLGQGCQVQLLSPHFPILPWHAQLLSLLKQLFGILRRQDLPQPPAQAVYSRKLP